MKYHCTGCDYIYNELLGDEDLEIEPHTLFEDLPSDFFCPLCDTHKDDFVVLDEPICVLDSNSFLTQFEALHVPVFEIRDDKIFIEVGQIDHPMTSEHFLYKISLHDDTGEEIDQKKLQLDDAPHASFDIDYLDTIEIRVYCSRDGVFSSGPVTIEV